MIDHGRRRIRHWNVTEPPIASWIWRQMIEATAWGQQRGFLIRDRDRSYGGDFIARARRIGIETILTPVRAPNANAIAERVIGTLRRECLDHVIAVNERHLRRVPGEYVQHYNAMRPHPSLALDSPEGRKPVQRMPSQRVDSKPVPGGLHHEYRWAYTYRIANFSVGGLHLRRGESCASWSRCRSSVHRMKAERIETLQIVRRVFLTFTRIIEANASSPSPIQTPTIVHNQLRGDVNCWDGPEPTAGMPVPEISVCPGTGSTSPPVLLEGCSTTPTASVGIPNWGRSVGSAFATRCASSAHTADGLAPPWEVVVVYLRQTR